jgi:hypothetical protein
MSITVRGVHIPAYNHSLEAEQDTLPYYTSPLALFHPTGVVDHAMSMGTHCPPLLRPQVPLPLTPSQQSKQATTSATNCGLGIIAPSVAELSRPGWLRHALNTQSAYLEQDGLIYLLLPPAWRLLAIRQLHQAGLHVDRLYLHLPHVQSSRYLVPLARPAADYAFTKLITMEPWKRTLIESALKVPGYGALFRTGFPGLAIVARKANAAPLFHWLTLAGAETVAHTPVQELILTISWRSQPGAVTLHGFSSPASGVEQGRLIWVAKTALSQRDDARRLAEESRLGQLGASARAAGAEVPQILGRTVVGGRAVLLQSPLDGVPLVTKLKGKPELMPLVVAKLASWLLQWHRLTAQPRPFGDMEWEEMVLAPTEVLLPHLRHPEYANALKARLAALGAIQMPFVAAHHDLTMWNVLMDQRMDQHGQLGIVDWEEASASALPLTDFLYAVADAAAAVDGYTDRLAALRACFTPTGSYFATVAQWRSQLQSALGLSRQAVELCSYACWLRHAANEQRSAQAGDSRPFLHILEWWIEHSIQRE